MANTIKVKQTSRVTTEIENPILIDKSETTRRLLLATVVQNPKDPTACVQGRIIHQRKTRSGDWETPQSINLATLKAGEGVQMRFSCEQLKGLREALAKAYTIGEKGVLPTGEYVFGGKEDVIIVEGSENKYIRMLLEKGFAEDIWQQLVDSNPDLATKLSLANIQATRLNAVSEFCISLEGDNTEKYWQEFLSNNDWIFGFCLSYHLTTMVDREVYVGGKNINGTNGEMCDFMAMSGGNAKFTALVEIKKPNTPLLSARPTRGNTYGVSKDLSDAIAQVQTYCYTWGTNNSREAYEFQYKNNSISAYPKGILVIGNTSELDNNDKIRSFELYRRSVLNPEIITYDELLARAKHITKYEENGLVRTSCDYSDVSF